MLSSSVSVQITLPIMLFLSPVASTTSLATGIYDLGKGRKCPCSYINVCVFKCQNAPGGSKLLNKYT